MFRANGNWHVYLLNNSGWDLYHMSGIGKDTFSSSTKVLDSGRIMGGGGPARLSNDRVAVFLVRDVNANGAVEVRIASVNTPEQLSAPVEAYNFGDTNHSLVPFPSEYDG